MLAAQILSGAGTGVLLGMLLGLSASPVVGLVVGALAAVLAPLVGVRLPRKEGDAPAEAETAAQKKAAAIRAGVFGFCCVLGLLIGIALRTHDALSPAAPTLKQRVDELVGVGFSPAEARRIAIVHALEAAPDAKTEKSAATVHNTLLFGSSTDGCERLSVDRFKDTAAAAAAYQAMDQPVLTRIATAINRQIADEKARMGMLRAVVEAVCAKP